MRLSVVIPASEECSVNSMESLKNQTKSPFEIIVKRGKNVSKNRNEGALKANGDLIAFINAHTTLKNNWVEEIEKFFLKNPKIDIVGGPQLTPVENNLFGKVSGFALSSFFGAANLRKRYSIGKTNFNAGEEDLTSANLVCKRNVFERVLFDETLYPGEDPKFISDCKKNKMNIAYSPEIIAYNKRRESFFNLLKQFFNYGKVRLKKESLFDSLKHPLFLFPSIFLIYLISIPFLFLIKNDLAIYLYLFPAFIYLLVDILFTIYGTLKFRNFFAGVYLLAIYPVIHLSYGAGFIRGFLK